MTKQQHGSGQHAPGSNTESRLVLHGVPKVGFYSGGEQCPEDVPFPSCLASALRYLGEEYPWSTMTEMGKEWRMNHANIEMMAASGIAFGLRWKPGWHQDNADMMFVADPSEIIRRAFAYAGYAFKGIEKKGDDGDRERLLNSIRSSLQEGKPVLGFGIVGPPECGLITGYDDGGDTLIGWSFFQSMPPFNAELEFEQEGYYRKSSWLKDTWSVLVIGEKTDRPSDRARRMDTLRWGLTVGRTPEVLGMPTGLRAYEAWAKQVTNDSDFLTDDERVLQSRYEVHNSAVGTLAECRWTASEYLKMIAPTEPSMAEDLLAVAALFRQEHDLMWRAWDLVGGFGNPDAFAKFADPEVGRGITRLILESRDLDAKALNLLESTLNNAQDAR